MIVCACRAVNDATLHAAVAGGASTREELSTSCGAGSRCGGCWPALERFIAEHCGASRVAAARPVRAAAA